jgi:purine nucleosidase
MSVKVIVDCDNTMGKPYSEIDDGLTLLYLLGREDIELQGITNCYANASLKDVEYWTNRFLHDIDRTDIPRFSGKPFHGQNETEWFKRTWGHHFINEKPTHSGPSDAAVFLVEQARKHKGELQLLALGSMTNLLEAWELDHSFFSNLAQIVLMGGVEPGTLVRGRPCLELNLACNPPAAHKVLHNGECKIVVMNAGTCLDAPFDHNDMERIRFWPERRKQMVREWLDVFEGTFYLWDLLPAVYLSYPDLFDTTKANIVSTAKDLEQGILMRGAGGTEIAMPQHIIDVKRLMDILGSGWQNAWEKENQGWS